LSGFSTAPFGPAAGPRWLGGNRPTFIDGPQPDIWSFETVQSRAVQNYAPLKSSIMLIPDAGAGGIVALEPSMSRSVPLWSSPRSRVSMQPDASTNTFADWTPGSIRDPDPAKPYAAPRSQTINVWMNPAASTDTVALPTIITSSPLRLYQAPRSQTMLVPLDTVYGTEYAPITRSVLPEPLTRSASMAIFAADNPLVTADSIAPIITSRSIPFYSPHPSIVVSEWLNTVFGAEYAPQAILSPRVYPLIQRAPVIGMAWDIGTIAPPGDPGGGGYGAVMSDAFFQRYDPRYQAQYAKQYKPTLRKQKKD
jgi:hypothetical protein